MKFKQEFEKNMKWGFLAIAIVLIAMAGFYFHAVQMDFNQECGDCITSDCMDNDITCGDFGFYYFKFLTLIGVGFMGVGIIVIPTGDKR